MGRDIVPRCPDDLNGRVGTPSRLDVVPRRPLLLFWQDEGANSFVTVE
jgi:hypothetical protein